MPHRPAMLEDARLISAWACHAVERWQRLDADGRAQDVPYDALTIYERWLHGGAWMSLETGVLWLSHLLRGAGVTTVLEDEDGRAYGYLEAFAGDEPAPFGKHLYLAYTCLAPDAPADGQDTLLQTALTLAQTHGGRLCVGASAHDEARLAFLARYGMTQVQTLQRYTLTTASGQGFYKATEEHPTQATVIKGWAMPLGRLMSARATWEAEWVGVWDALPPIAQRRTHRVRCSASGHEAFLLFQVSLYNPRLADVSCWSQKPFSAPLVVAIRDWAQRNGYRELRLWAEPNVAKAFGNELEATPQQHVAFVRDV